MNERDDDDDVYSTVVAGHVGLLVLLVCVVTEVFFSAKRPTCE